MWPFQQVVIQSLSGQVFCKASPRQCASLSAILTQIYPFFSSLFTCILFLFSVSFRAFLEPVSEATRADQSL